MSFAELNPKRSTFFLVPASPGPYTSAPQAKPVWMFHSIVPVRVPDGAIHGLERMQSEARGSSSGGAVTPIRAGAFPRSEVKGVGGWLLLFCLILTILGPLVRLGFLAFSYFRAVHYRAQHPGLLLHVFLTTPVSLAIVAFGIYAGLGLWRIRPGAVTTAKYYLWFVLVANIFLSVLGLLFVTTSAAKQNIVNSLVNATVGFFLWYAYLTKSKRVANTYPQETDERPKISERASDASTEQEDLGDLGRTSGW